MFLSTREMRELVIQDPKVMQEAREWWKKEEWDTIGDRILIEPLNIDKIRLCHYELSVGDMYVSLRDPYKPRKLVEGEMIPLGPMETVLILTREYIGLPRTVMGLVVPRAGLIFEGASLNATRIDPTWCGKLIIGFTNNLNIPIVLRKGEDFCTCLFIKVSPVEKSLKELRAKGLGREILEVDYSHIRPRDLIKPDQVTDEQINALVEAHGSPYDIVVGAIEKIRKEVIEFLEREQGPKIAEQASLRATERAYGRLFEAFEALSNVHRGLSSLIFRTMTIIASLMAIFMGLVSWLLKSR